MPIHRMDLADAGSPEKLVTLILQGEPDLPIPVPLEELCKQLDIEEIRDLESEGFEGGLITDMDRSFGFILARKAFEPRRRFTIAHELGHFLMPLHIPDGEGRFLCSRQDMNRLSAKENDRRQRMEVEANRFASLLLMPAPMLRRRMGSYRDADLAHITKLARDFKVSKEAMARAYAQYSETAVAVILAKDGRIVRCHRHFSFPTVVPSIGTAIPSNSLFHRKRHELSIPSAIEPSLADTWLEVRRGERAPTLYEQVLLRNEGFAFIMLHIEKRDEDEIDEEQSLEESWSVRFPGRHRRR